ncbi:MAG: hypothetical protein JRI23_24850, partial [Deltaproteobacteria bacterium]|nr:hypothetical protein [Deltaproteobacteria bacterium]MBW2535242.1 hypothetical protein [Deltaproteobacteria bacterium]
MASSPKASLLRLLPSLFVVTLGCNALLGFDEDFVGEGETTSSGTTATATTAGTGTA